MTTRTSPGDPLGSVAVIANGRAGSTTPELGAAIAALCTEHDVRSEVFWTEHRGHATEIATAIAQRGASPESVDAIVAVGGDGTLREVAAGLLSAGCHAPALVVLPGGTGNSNYRSLWDDLPWQEALAAAISGAGSEHRLLDLARIDERLVLLGASTGVFAEATAVALSLPVAGRARYQQAIDTVLATHRPYPGRVTVDGAVLYEGPTNLVNVGGGRHRAGVFNMLPRSLRDDGLLDVCVLGTELDPAQALTLARNGEHLGQPGVAYGTGRSILVERTDGRPLPFEHDGEVAADPRESFTVEILPRALPVISSSKRTGG